MLRKVLVLSLCSTLVAACSSDSDSATSSTQLQALNRSSTALSSLYSANDSLALSSRAQSTDSICDANGAPTATGNDVEWAFTKFLCAGAHNTYSPDSALGALSLSSGIVCTADRLGLRYTADGATTTVSGAAFSTACFPQDMITKFANESTPITSITADITGFTMESTTGWDYRIELRNSPTIGDFDLYIRNSDNVIAASMINTVDSDGWTITIDRRADTKYLIYEAANTNTHMRIMAEGDIAANGTVGDVSNMAGIHAVSGSDQYVALRGNDANGVQIQWKKSGIAEVGTQCADLASNGATCAGVTALGFAAADTGAFTNAGAAITNSLAAFDNNPISMTVSGFIEDDVATAAFSSTLR